MVADRKNTTEIVQSFLEVSGYLKYLTTNETIQKKEQLDYLSQFYKKIQEFEKESDDKSVRNFLALVDLELESGEEGTLKQNLEESSPDTVKVMTIHSAKGLEFKYVFITNLVAQRFPTNRRGDAIVLPESLVKEIVPEGDFHLQEERRLFYVAITRAKKGVYFTSAEDYGGTRKKRLSRFMVELADNGFSLAKNIQKTGSNQPITQLAIKSDQKEIIQVPNRFSFSQLNMFINCPYQYRFAYGLKIPTRGSKHFSFGTTMHNTLQKFFQLMNEKNNTNQGELFNENKKTTNVITEDELLNIYRQSFIDDWYTSREERNEYFVKGEKSLRVFYKRAIKERPKVEFLEYPFMLKLQGKEVYSFFGKIDRIDRVGDKIRIIDYKTGRAKKNLLTDDKDQLLIYQLAAQEVMGEQVVELVFHYLDEDQKISFLGGEKDLVKIKNKIIKNIENIKVGNFIAKPKYGAKSCQWCNFNSICEYRVF